ncbi:MAG: ParB/RepB/Spo0J family partition protein [Deltaproteobacteria bacterium]|nr:ParB/RepB/Spo0J family partition protein [Deltaproteobacteria bacterium]
MTVKKTSQSIYQEIELSIIDEPEGRIRLEIDDEDIESLADNIKEVGQIQPINLIKRGSRYEIIAGHMRYLAIKKLGRKTINALIMDADKTEVALIRASENLKRRNLSPIEEGAVYADLIDEHGMTKMGIAEKFGVPASTVKYKLDLLNLHPEIQKLIHKGLIYINVGAELNNIDNERQLRKCLDDAVNNGCKIETARGWVRDYRKSLTYEPTGDYGGSPPEQELNTTKNYQACELCEEPVEIQAMKMLRICPGCMKIIIDNMKPGA